MRPPLGECSICVTHMLAYGPSTIRLMSLELTVISSTYQKQVDDLLERRHLGTQAPCFMTEFFDMGKDKEFTAEESYFMAGTMMEAGSETTRTSLHELAAGAALFPEWVATARKELDEVCGGNAERLPELSDMPNLPYIKAIAKETLRWK